MRKQTKIAALVSAAALLAIGASMTSFAYGWNFDGMEWEWLDRDGNRVTETWKTSGGKYYWLDENGAMATDQLIEDNENYYYVDENGVRVTNQWHSFVNEDQEEVNGAAVGTLWYYFGNTGAAYKHTNATNGEIVIKTVSWNGQTGKFGFDENGRMVSGWAEVQDSNGNTDFYYFGDEDDGRVHTDWQMLEPAEFMSSDHDDQEWFYFQGSGKAVRADDYDEKKDKYIKGRYYSFDRDGVLQDDWFGEATSSTAASPVELTSSAVAYANVDGAKTGWVYTEKQDGSGDNAWFYLIKTKDHKTVPYNIRYDGETKPYAARYINGKTYLFDGTGAMKTGVVKLNAGNLVTTKSDADFVDIYKNLQPGYYYFSKLPASQGSDGRMMIGRQAIDEEGDTYYYYFKKDGRAVTDQIYDNTLYGNNGRRIQADDNTYRIISIGDAISDELIGGTGLKLGNNATEGKTKGTIIVTSTGKVKKNSKVTIDGVRYTIGSDYLVTGAVYKDEPTQEAPYEHAE